MDFQSTQVPRITHRHLLLHRPKFHKETMNRQGPSRAAGLSGRSELGCFEGCRRWFAVAEEPGHRGESMLNRKDGHGWCSRSRRRGARELFPGNLSWRQGPRKRRWDVGVARKTGGHAQVNPCVCITLYYGYWALMGAAGYSLMERPPGDDLVITG